jgi:predicted dehydrogenase
VGMIGGGRAAVEHHLPALGRIDDAEVVALADPSEEALRQTGEAFGIARRSADYQELLADESIEAVCLATPSDLHAEMTMAALDAGKHVLVEKPLALTLEDCDRMIERAAASDRKTLVGFNLRWHRLVQRALELIRGGRIGKVRLLRSVFATPSLVTGGIPDWRLDPGQGGGMFALQSVHHLDLWRFLLGEEIEQIYCAASGQPDAPGPGTAAMVATTSGGTRIAGEICAVTGQENEFAVYGSEGWLGASLYRFDSFEFVPQFSTVGDLGRRVRGLGRFAGELRRAVPNIRRGGDFHASYEAEWRHFIEVVRRDVPAECSFEDGREAARILLAALESAESGQPVRVAETGRAGGTRTATART